MRKMAVPIIAGFVLAVAAAPALAGGLGCGGAVHIQSAGTEGPVSAPVDTVSTIKPDTNG